VSNPIDKAAADKDHAFGANRLGSHPQNAPHGHNRRSPLPLGATWIEEEQAFNFAVYAEHAASVTLLLYSADDLAHPILTFHFDYIRNKSGQIWHCRLPLDKIRRARYYAYSVSGQVASEP
jgi:pullulanase/glycogen debranching enzyme